MGPRQRLPIFDTHELRDFLAEPGPPLPGRAAGVVHPCGQRQRRGHHPAGRLAPAAVLRARPGQDGRPARRRHRPRAARHLPASGRPRPVPDRRVPRPHRPPGLTAPWTRAGCSAPAGRAAPAPPAPASSRDAEDHGAVGLLEELGRRWYRLAHDSLPVPAPSGMHVLGDLAERFSQARRILNVVTDRYLFAFRDRWFRRRWLVQQGDGIADGQRPPVTISARRPPLPRRARCTPAVVSASRWRHGGQIRTPMHSTAPTASAGRAATTGRRPGSRRCAWRRPAPA